VVFFLAGAEFDGDAGHAFGGVRRCQWVFNGWVQSEHSHLVRLLIIWRFADVDRWCCCCEGGFCCCAGYCCCGCKGGFVKVTSIVVMAKVVVVVVSIVLFTLFFKGCWLLCWFLTLMFEGCVRAAECRW